ncbi:MAG: hypothetical protein JWN64_710 [Parcubacteria group bacterium]|nr:hypothetical protein [Parcubacteria group bacterium]
MGLEGLSGKRTSMPQQRRAPEFVRRVLESGNPKAISEMRQRAAEAAKKAGALRREKNKVKKQLAASVADEYRLKQEAELKAHLKETNEDVIPVSTYD